jgi:hypothetical protein
MDLDRWRIGSINARAQEGILDAIEAIRMNLSNGEKAMFGMIGFCLFVWLFGSSAKPDPTQCDIPTSSTELIAQVQSVQEHIVDANKTIDSTPSPSDRHEKIKREVLVFVSSNCPPCERWKRCEMQRFMDAGWSVGIVENHSYGLTPTFEIESGGKKATIKGYTTLEQAAEAVR